MSILTDYERAQLAEWREFNIEDYSKSMDKMIQDFSQVKDLNATIKLLLDLNFSPDDICDFLRKLF